MGRSASVPKDAYVTAYIDAADYADISGDREWDWCDFLEDLRWQIKRKYPSFEDQYELRTDGREEYTILRNEHAQVVVCTYCDVVSVSLIRVPYRGRPFYPELAGSWCEQVSLDFRAYLEKKFPCLRRHGTMSNGVVLYSHV